MYENEELIPINLCKAIAWVCLLIFSVAAITAFTCNVLKGCKRIRDNGGMRADTVKKIAWMNELYGGERR